MKRFIALASLFVLASLGAQEVENNAALGVSAKNAPGWTMISESERQARMKSTELNQPGLKELVAAYMSKPFLIFTKPRSISPQPVITALVAPLGSGMTADPVENLQKMVGAGPRAFADYQLVEKPHSATIGGRPGAYCRATYTLKTRGGDSFPVSFETWQAIRGDYYFLIGVVSREPEDAATAGEIKQIIASFKIDDVKGN